MKGKRGGGTGFGLRKEERVQQRRQDVEGNREGGTAITT
jgi:hypothetical protein